MLASVLLAVAIAGYLLGSIPTADLVVGRGRHRVDLRAVGDRNPGYWNAKEQLGRRAAFPVLAVDVAKGASAAGVGWLAADPGEWWFAVVGTGAAMVGHCWPIFARFRGGRGVATFIGGAIVISPITGAVAGLVLLAVWAVTRSFAWGARAAFVAYPLAQLVIDSPARTAATGVLMTLIGFRFATAPRPAIDATPPAVAPGHDPPGDGQRGDGVGGR
jgi:glycerol-3-phosphate acyltransferase PlsY